MFTLALDERESLLEVLLSFELFIGEEMLGDFFDGVLDSDSVFKGSLNVAGFAGLVIAGGWWKLLLLPNILLGDEEGIPFGMDDLGGGGGGGIPASPL